MLAGGEYPGEGGRRRARAGQRGRLPRGARRARLQRRLARARRAERPFTRMVPGEPGTDRWQATIRPDAVGTWTFTVEAFADPYLTWRNAVMKKMDAGQGAKELANDLAIGADVLDRAAKTVPTERAQPRCSTRPRRCATRTCRWASGPIRRSTWPTCSGSTRSASSSRSAPTRRSGSTGRGRCSRPGTSSSRAPRGRRSTSRAAGQARHVRHGGAAAARRSRRWASTWSTCRRSTRSAGSTARAATTPWWPAGGRRLAVGDRVAEGGHDAIHPQLGTARADFRRFVERGATRWASRSRWTSPCSAPPTIPWVKRAPGVVHHAARRHDRLRREPAEEVPGHLPAQLRQRPGGHPGRGAAGRAALGRPGRQDLPGGQPAHQADRLLALADLAGQADRPGRAVPGRGVHPAGHHARAGHDRLHPVLHVLHLADQRPRAARVLRGAGGRGRPHATQLLAQHPRHPARDACSTAGRPCSRSGRCWPACSRRPGASTPGYELYEHVARPGAEEYLDNEKYQLRPRDVGGGRDGPASRWRRSSPGSTRSGATTRPCTGCATCASTRSTTTRCCVGPNATPTPATPCWWSAPWTRATRTGPTPRWTCPPSGSTGTSGCRSATS